MTSPSNRRWPILEAAADSEVAFFDAADVYGSGRSECSSASSSRVAADYSWRRRWAARAASTRTSTEAGLRAATEASLQRSGRGDASTSRKVASHPDRGIEARRCFRMAAQAAAGRKDPALRRECGIHRGGSHLCGAAAASRPLQIIFNIFRQRSDRPSCSPSRKERGIAVIVRLPLASGLLTGKFTKDTTFAVNDHRNFNRDGQAFNVGETFSGIPFDKGVELAEEMKAFVPESLSMVQMAQRWILDYEEVTVVIPGASSTEQAKENASVSDLARAHASASRSSRTLLPHAGFAVHSRSVLSVAAAGSLG